MIFSKDRIKCAADNFFIDKELLDSAGTSDIQTQDVFSKKWDELSEEDMDSDEGWKSFQLQWFLELYGFNSANFLIDYIKDLSKSPVIIDAGCGKGYKTNWLSSLNKDAEVIGIDFSTSVNAAARRYSNNKQISFLQADISKLPIQTNSVDLIVCDQVLHHTFSPPKTLKEFSRVLKKGGRLFTYVYKKKALPRELLDEHFRSAVHELNEKQIWEISKGMTDLGKLLSENDVELDFPEIKALGIKGGKQSLQRFLYWNFFKCFWNDDFGYDASLSTNFDWYSPSIAYRYSKEEFSKMIESEFNIEFLHEEDACFSGRFKVNLESSLDK